MAGGVHADQSADETFTPTGAELTLICGHDARISQGGVLLWDNAGERDSHNAPYSLVCPDFSLHSDGQRLRVQATTLAQALGHFDADASFLAYYADLTVRFPGPGLLSADSTESVAEVLRPELLGINISASQPGQPERALMTYGHLTPLSYDPALPLILRLHADASPLEWTEVTIEADKGLITAPLPRP